MIFFLNLDGTCTRQDTDHIYQGSNNVSKVIAITSIAPDQSRIGVAFTLPNGLPVGYLPMASKGAYNVKDNPTPMYLWELDLPYNVTDVQGTVGVSFNVVNSITGANMTSYTNTFEVEYSALPIPPSSATESELEQILNLLEAYAAVNPGIVEKLENFQIGTVTAQASEPGAQPEVTAEIVNETTPNGYKLNMNFTLPRGEKGDKGDALSGVTGVKGSAETEYRQGYVNLTAQDVGAVPVTGGTVNGNFYVTGGIEAANQQARILGNSMELKSNVADITADSIPADAFPNFSTYDKNGNWYATYRGVQHATDGAMSAQLGVHRMVNGEAAERTVSMRLQKDGYSTFHPLWGDTDLGWLNETWRNIYHNGYINKFRYATWIHDETYVSTGIHPYNQGPRSTATASQITFIMGYGGLFKVMTLPYNEWMQVKTWQLGSEGAYVNFSAVSENDIMSDTKINIIDASSNTIFDIIIQ